VYCVQKIFASSTVTVREADLFIGRGNCGRKLELEDGTRHGIEKVTLENTIKM
jgi:hypothetical protein